MVDLMCQLITGHEHEERDGDEHQFLESRDLVAGCTAVDRGGQERQRDHHAPQPQSHRHDVILGVGRLAEAADVAGHDEQDADAHTEELRSFATSSGAMSTSSVRKVTPAMPMAAVAYHRRQDPAGTSPAAMMAARMAIASATTSENSAL